MAAKEKCPDAFDVVVYFVLAASSVSTTFAPAMTAPVMSVTSPLRELVTVWPRPDCDKTKNRMAEIKERLHFRIGRTPGGNLEEQTAVTKRRARDAFASSLAKPQKRLP